jgi:hypothetical protein
MRWWCGWIGGVVRPGKWSIVIIEDARTRGALWIGVVGGFRIVMFGVRVRCEVGLGRYDDR